MVFLPATPVDTVGHLEAANRKTVDRLDVQIEEPGLREM